MRSKLLDKKTRRKLLNMAIIGASYVALYHITYYTAGKDAAEKLQGLAKLLQAVNGG